MALASAARAESPNIFPLSEVRPGLKGVGRSVFEGTRVEEFDVTVLEVIRNYLPGQDLILAEVGGAAVEGAGVISGMSGSPVYFDGRLAGAVAYRFGAFPRRAIAGITPIESMLALLRTGDKGDGSEKAEESGHAPWLPYFAEQAGAAPAPVAGGGPETSHPPLALETPVTMGGFSPAVIERFRPRLEGLGLIPVASGSSSAKNVAIKLEAGAAVSAQLIRGDMSMSATGTLTHIEGDRLLAFGHPFLLGGEVDLPIAPARVLAVVPGDALSFKITSDAESVGSWVQDRASGLVGRLNRVAPMIAAEVTVKGDRTYRFETVREPSLTPILLQLALTNTVTQAAGRTDPLTIEAEGRLEIEGAASLPIGGFYSGDMALAAMVSDVASLVGWLLSNPYRPVRIGPLKLDVSASRGDRGAVVERLTLGRDAFEPGEKIQVEVGIRAVRRGTRSITHVLPLPPNLPAGGYVLWVGDARAAAREDLKTLAGAPDLDPVLDLLRRPYDTRRLYVRLLRRGGAVLTGGRRLAQLPPSVQELLVSELDQADGRGTGDLVLLESTIQTDFQVRGLKQTAITVEPSWRK